MTKHKSDLTAETLKITGSSKFSKRYFQDALINYNEGLCRAESNFLKSLLYGNRSAVYFEVGKYKECIENIQLAKEHGYPADKIDKLNKREEKCLKTMESKQSKVEINKNEPFSDFIKLSYKGHDKIPFIIEEIEKRNSKKYGNYLITTKDLKTGDIIAIEEPFVKIIDREYKYERCSYCLKQNSYNFIPCDHCCEVMYCSKVCYESSNHKNYCCHEALSERSHLEACGNLIIKGVEQFGSFQKFFEYFENPKKLTIFDIDEINEKNGVLILISMATSKDSDTGLIYGFEEGILNTYPFNQYCTTSENCEKILKCFEHLCKIFNNNSIQMTEINNEDQNTYKLYGGGIGLFSSLFSHSCIPNISRVTFDNKIVFFVNRPIKAGEQLFIFYTDSFALESKIDRQRYLKNYGIDCDCDACKSEFPLLEELPHIVSNYSAPSFDNIFRNNNNDNELAINQFKRNCKFIDNFWNSQPDYETTLTILSNDHLISEIVKFEMKLF